MMAVDRPGVTESASGAARRGTWAWRAGGGSGLPATAEATCRSSVDETLAKLLKRRPAYAASRMSQLRKSSNAAS